MAQTALLAAFVAGLFGGLHCVAMCGGWIAASVSRAPRGAVPLLPARTLLSRQLASHAGRLGVYALLGAALGATGGAAFAHALLPAQRMLYVAANVVLILLAASLVQRSVRASAVVEGAGLRLFRRVAPAAMRIAHRDGIAGPLVLGALWGLTPCALVYGLLPVALLSGSALDGALVMLAFGAGTLPNLLAAQFALARLPGQAVKPGLRIGAALVIAAFGVTGIYRALYVPEALAAGPFCLVPFDVHGKLPASSP